ncbi:MAG: hypothetical protein A3A80_01840 [Candidatus Terrybacteria bacterium RIFCSPLOWO2_01_FULL_44_24]|uniref:Uncharacterized protein n=1 Tax=Candidatus Terrybacteria bacterium RIFCSPHIGHO2_01_FULL_43_35 TaxID=1802361 RepID=A0A1G2PFQ6_9BACT|nr:MAG: hypothetical protein A2828_01630 [Candidatus Terrybacteria bacterium RIFCSPHIGHO2_01_FULL_43_35]OHA50826.1 MAG: hypothetical protein A3A80_01840 [Candidatus Terrybacteria bacterium RIFCSPLOWO2_01_FULL_44_24]
MLPDAYENDYYKVEVISKIIIDGHEVVWVKTTAKIDYVEYMVACECGLNKQSGEFDPWHGWDCKYINAAMFLRRYEISQELAGKHDLDSHESKFPYISDAFKNAVFELFTRSQNNEWLGGNTNYLPGTLVSAILENAMEFGADMEHVWTAVNMLECEGKLASGTGTGASWAGILIPHDARRNRKNPVFPYSEKQVSNFKIKVFSPISGFEPLEWLIQVYNSKGKIVYEERVAIKYHPKWVTGSEIREGFHPTDVAQLNLALAKTEEKIWEMT